MTAARLPSGPLLLVAVAVKIFALQVFAVQVFAAEPAAAPAMLRTEKTKVTAILDELPKAGAIAVKPTGQAFLAVDGGSNAVEMIDLAEPARRQRVVGRFPGSEKPLAVACIDSITCAVVTRSGRDWAVKTYRLAAPGNEVDSANTLQSIPLGRADADADAAVCIAVSPSRTWVVVAGLPSPLPPVIRGAIAGARIGGMSTRNCPGGGERPGEGEGNDDEGEAGFAVAAATISPGEKLVLFERPDSVASTGRLAMYSTIGGIRLMSLDSGLPRVRAAAYADDVLWAVAGNPSDDRFPEGLWRIDATIRNRRQAVRPVCVARLASPVALAPLSGGRLLVVHGEAKRTVSIVEPSQ